MAAVFPPVARFVFGVLEPLSLLAGAAAPFIDAQYFVSSQLALEPVHALLPVERVLAMQLGNLYLLFAFIGVFVQHTTTEPKVAHAYIWALWLGDVGHIAVTCLAMGKDEFLNIAGWNAMAWGNLGATATLFGFRCAYLLGLLGPDRVPKEKRK